MLRFVSPAEYVQGPGALSCLPAFAARAGTNAAIVIDGGIDEMVSPLIGEAYGPRHPPPRCRIGGEVTHAAIAALAQSLPADAAVVIGVGGGKAIDMAKGAARVRGLPVISVPTVASSDAPASRVYAVYDDAHRLVAVEHMQASPLAVIADTALMVRAPLRLMRAGIGDAIAKSFEADAAWAAQGRNMLGSAPPAIGRAIARAAYDTIRLQGQAGLAAMKQGAPDAAFEALVEACVLMSGLGFENGGLSLAHSVTRGLMCSPHGADALHGEHVAYGVMVQVAAERRDGGFIDELAGFLRDVGLPFSLRSMSGRRAELADFAQIAAATMQAPHLANFPLPLDAMALVRAMQEVEARSESTASRGPWP
ncbi:iron-containing alcohol dehydrogenase [Cupriavidus sp. 30B13]|uniref:iron-containing alcohol dehydrogenase n=1 Tax=Cupriavidus sp. 30B13 TaxID=3384241 RepID=UPI003B8F2D6C